MDTSSKRLRCTVGWHHWRLVDEELMVVRTCTECGRRRYHGPLPAAGARRRGAFVVGGLGVGGGAVGGFGGFGVDSGVGDGDC